MSEYLAIDGWEEFQSLRGKGLWIKDATDQQDKPKLGGLSFCEIGVLQQLRRLRGRTGKNIKYDIIYIAGAIHAKVTDRAHLHHAIGTLISRGVLIVTDQAHSSFNEGEKEIEKESKKEKKPSAKAAPRGSLKPTDPRFPHCVEILHRYWDKFAKEQVRFDLWLDKPGYKQLKNSLQRHETMSVEDFTRFVANRARSPGVNHYQPAYEWLGHILDWAGGPKANGNKRLTDQDSKAGTSLAVAAGMGKVFGRADAVGGEHVPVTAAPNPRNTS